jgi:hypothetical protein
MADQTFSSGQILTAAQMTTLQQDIGLTWIATTTYTASTAASVTASVLGCFTSSFANYKVIVSHYGSASTTFSFQMISGAGVDSGANYFGYGLAYNAGTTDIGAAAATSQRCGGHSSTSTILCETVMDIANPNIAARTQATIHAFDANGPSVQLIGAQVATTTQYTGIQLIPASGSITGTIRVYGYRNL